MTSASPIMLHARQMNLPMISGSGLQVSGSLPTWQLSVKNGTGLTVSPSGIGLSGSTILLFTSGSPVREYPTTSDGLVTALSVSKSGDVVQLPVCNLSKIYPDYWMVPSGVQITGTGRNSFLNGEVRGPSGGLGYLNSLRVLKLGDNLYPGWQFTNTTSACGFLSAGSDYTRVGPYGTGTHSWYCFVIKPPIGYYQDSDGYYRDSTLVDIRLIDASTTAVIWSQTFGAYKLRNNITGYPDRNPATFNYGSGINGALATRLSEWYAYLPIQYSSGNFYIDARFSPTGTYQYGSIGFEIKTAVDNYSFRSNNLVIDDVIFSSNYFPNGQSELSDRSTWNAWYYPWLHANDIDAAPTFDTDSPLDSGIHHTLGTSHGQAAFGDHNHYGQYVSQIITGNGLSGGTISTSGTVSLANTPVSPGTYNLASIVVDQQGRITSACSGSVAGTGTVTQIQTGTGLTGGPISTSGTIVLANTSVVSGSYINANIVVDAQGRITSASNGSSGSSVSASPAHVIMKSGSALQQQPYLNFIGSVVTIANNTSSSSTDITILSGSGVAGVSQVNTGTGLTGGPISTSGTISLANTSVCAGSYTNASITVDAQGRLTSACSGSATTSGSPAQIIELNGSAYPYQKYLNFLGGVVSISNNTSASSTDVTIISTSGTVTQIQTSTGLTGGPISTSGTISLANTSVISGSYINASFFVDAQGRLTSASNGSMTSSSPAHVIYQNDSPLAQQPILRFLGSAVSASNNLSASSTDITIISSGSSSGGGHTIQTSGSSLPQQTYLNFIGSGVSASNNLSASSTDINIPGFVQNDSELTWFIDGYLATGTGFINFPFTRSTTIKDVRIWAATKGSSGNTIIDAHVNGTTIFTTQANRPNLAFNASFVAVSGTPDNTVFNENDILTIDIDSVATGCAGLSICVKLSGSSGSYVSSGGSTTVDDTVQTSAIIYAYYNFI